MLAREANSPSCVGGTGRRQGEGNENDPGGKRSGYKEHESRRHAKKIENLFGF